MMAGRPKDSTAAKKARGSRNVKSQKKPGVTLPEGEPMRPDNLSKEEEYYWNFYITLFRDQGILTQMDGRTLKIFCFRLVRCDFLEDKVKKLMKKDELFYSIGHNGAITPHPCLKQLNEIEKEIAASCRILGLDPLNRSGIKKADPKKDSKFKFNRKK